MLATGFNLCQGMCCVFGGEIPQLAAGAKDVAPSAFTHEHVKARLAQDGLKGRNIAIRWAAEGTPGKFIERDYIDLARNPTDEFSEAASVVAIIVHPG